DGKLNQVCKAFGTTFDKYPFRRSASVDATLEEFSAWFAPETGHIWKFQMQTLAPMTQKEGSQWKVKVDPSQKLQVTGQMLAFLNRAQEIRDTFFPKNEPQPQFTYSLRPKLDAAFTSILELEVDGQLQQFTSALQKQFSWPAVPGTQPGAIARIRTGGVASAFLSHGGAWGVFRMMDDAENRSPEATLIEWKYSKAGGGRDPIQPAPVRLEFPAFPNGNNVFHPTFFEGVRCPGSAVQ